MKRIFFCFCVIVLVFSVKAQKTIYVDDQTIVKDSSGTVLAVSAWKALMATGKYSLKPETPGVSGASFRIYRMTEEEIKRRWAAMSKPHESPYFTTGKKPASFSGKDLEGNKYKLKDLTGKVVVLNFWFIGCGPCRMEMPELNKLVDDYKDSSNTVFLAIALDGVNEVEEFIKKSPFNYNIIADGRYISSIYRVMGYPTHAVIDKAGNVTFHTTGYGSATIPWLRKSIVQALH